MDATAAGTLPDILVMQHGFRATPSGPIGTRHGLPMRVAADRAPNRNNQKVLRLSIGTADLATAEAAVASLRADKKQLPAKLLGVEVVEGGVTVDLPAKLEKAPADEALAAVDAVAQRIAAIPGAVPVAIDGAQLTTVDGVPRWLTASDREAIEAQARAAAEAYAAIRPNVAGGLIAAAVGALVLAGAWAALSAYADMRAWFVAIGGGLLISFLGVKVARRPVTVIRVAVFAFTLLGVFLGEVLGFALVIRDIAGVFDLGLAFELYGDVMSEDIGGVLFAFGGGVLGAFFGMQAASPPSFDREIEVH